MTNASRTHFGIEIETIVPTVNSIECGGYHRGRQISILPIGWNGQHDNSVSGNGQAVEVVSPILQGENGLAQAALTAQTMRDLGARSNGTCGHHVHVECESTNVAMRRRVAKVAKRYEMALYALNGRKAWDRYENPYCMPLSRLSHIDNGMPCGHFAGVNFANAHTVEFRMFAATWDMQDIVSRIAVAVALVTYAREYASEVDAMPDGVILDEMEAAREVITIMCKPRVRLHPEVDDWTDLRDHILSRVRQAARLGR